MQKFFVLYLAPAAGLEAWMKRDPAERKAAEDKMMSEWNAWTEAHASMLVGSAAGLGKTKRVTPEGIEDTTNDLMLYSIAEAESHEAAAEAFKDHPHFGIRGGTIEIMPINTLSGM